MMVFFVGSDAVDDLAVVGSVNERLKVADSETEYATKDMVDAEFANYAKVSEFKGLQGAVQRMQADNISSAATFVKRKEAKETFAAKDRLQQIEERMEAMQKEYEAKLEAMQKESCTAERPQ